MDSLAALVRAVVKVSDDVFKAPFKASGPFRAWV